MHLNTILSTEQKIQLYQSDIAYYESIKKQNPADFNAQRHYDKKINITRQLLERVNPIRLPSLRD